MRRTRRGSRSSSTGWRTTPRSTTVDHRAPGLLRAQADGTLMNARDNEGHETDWTDVAELQLHNPALRAGHDRRDEVVAGLDGDRRLPLRRRRRRADRLLGQARTALKAARPTCSCSRRRRTRGMHAAFDMTYGWELHHLMNEIAQGKQNASALDAYFARNDSLYGPRRVSHVLHQQSRREQLERLGVRADGREPQAGVRAERDGASVECRCCTRGRRSA